MEDWDRLTEAGRELARAFHLLDRMDAISGFSAAAVLAGEELLAAARASVKRVDTLLGRA